MTNIGEQIINARKAKGMTQDALAKALHVSRSAVAHWESDRRLPDAEMLLKLSAILEYSFEDQSTRTSQDVSSAPETPEENPAGANASPEVRRFSPMRWIALAAAVLAVAVCAVAFTVGRGRREADGKAPAGKPAYPVEYFQQSAPNEPGKAYLRLSATASIQSGNNRDYQMYTFRLVELNGIGFTIDSLEVCGYGDGSFHSDIYTEKDFKTGNLDPAMTPYGSFEFTGGFPTGAFNSVGVIVRGRDANGEALSFTGYAAF